jgi:hypothetical protein
MKKPHPLSRAALGIEPKKVSAATRARRNQYQRALRAKKALAEGRVFIPRNGSRSDVVESPTLQRAAKVDHQVHWCPRCGLDIDAQRAAMSFKRSQI